MREVRRRAVSKAAIATILGGLILLPRTYVYPAVFRKGDIVLLENDPYYYRYVVERITADAAGPLDPTLLTNGQTSPLSVAMLAWTAEFLGGGLGTVGTVLAWYPPIVAVATGALVYLLAVRLTGSRVAGIVSTAMLAITPIHVVRTALGFSYHHAFDYAWLALTLLSLVWLARTEGDWRSATTWGMGLLLGVGVAGQVLAWDGGVLLVIPIGLYAALAALSALRAGRSPLADTAGLTIGVGIGAAVVVLAMATLGWHAKHPEIAYMPAVLFGGVVGVVAFSEGAYRAGLSARVTAALELAALVPVATAILTLPWTRTVLDSGLEYFARTGETNIAETYSLVDGPAGFVTGPFALFGILLLLTAPALLLGIRAAVREHRPAWIAMAVYASYFTLLALVQRRFAGELSVVVAPLAGITVLYVGARLGVIRWKSPFAGRNAVPTPPLGFTPDVERPALAVFLALLMVTAAASAFVIPITMNHATIDDDEHDAAQFMAEYSETHGLEYPDNYVLSWWGHSRMYNYFVSFHAMPSLRYQYAQSQYVPFLEATVPEDQYDRYHSRVGFVVTTDDHQPPRDVRVAVGNDTVSVTMYARLHERLGSRAANVSGVAHYRAVFVSEDGSVKVFRLVPGATINGTAEPNTTLELSTEVSLQQQTFTYTRHVRTDADGEYSVTVPYPGEYTLDGTTVRVSEPAIEDGDTIRGPSPGGE